MGCCRMDAGTHVVRVIEGEPLRAGAAVVGVVPQAEGMFRW